MFRVLFVLSAVLALQSGASAQQCANGTCPNPFGIRIPSNATLASCSPGQSLSAAPVRQGVIGQIVANVKERRAERKAARAAK